MEKKNSVRASRYIGLTRLFIKNNDLSKAWTFAVKTHKLYPITESKNFLVTLRAELEKSKDWSTIYDGSDASKKIDSLFRDSSIKTDSDKDKASSFLKKAERLMKKKDFKMAEKLLINSKKLFSMAQTNEYLKKLQEMKGNSNVKYTRKQTKMVHKAMNSENHYTLLEIKNNATVPEIKKSYKKLALLLHPDKNPAPGSSEAFVAVRNAVDTLCDKKKRLAYDLRLFMSLNN